MGHRPDRNGQRPHPVPPRRARPQSAGGDPLARRRSRSGQAARARLRRRPAQRPAGLPEFTLRSPHVPPTTALDQPRHRPRRLFAARPAGRHQCRPGATGDPADLQPLGGGRPGPGQQRPGLLPGQGRPGQGPRRVPRRAEGLGRAATAADRPAGRGQPRLAGAVLAGQEGPGRAPGRTVAEEQPAGRRRGLAKASVVVQGSPPTNTSSSTARSTSPTPPPRPAIARYWKPSAPTSSNWPRTSWRAGRTTAACSPR